MGNEHTDYEGDVDVPVEAIQVIDPEVVQSVSSIHARKHTNTCANRGVYMSRTSAWNSCYSDFPAWRQLLDADGET